MRINKGVGDQTLPTPTLPKTNQQNKLKEKKKKKIADKNIKNKKCSQNFSQKFFENFKIKIRINRSKFRLAACSMRLQDKK